MLVHLIFRCFDVAVESRHGLGLELGRAQGGVWENRRESQADDVADAGSYHAGTGAVSSFRPSVRKFSSVDKMADPAITRAIGKAGLSMNPRNVVMM